MQRLITTLTLFTLFLSPTFAQSESQRIITPIAPLLNENTAVVAHIDLSQVKPDDIAAKLKPMLSKLGIPTEQLDAAPAMLKPNLAALTALKVRDIYFLSYVPLLPKYPGFVAIPLDKASDADAVKKILGHPGFPDESFAKTIGNFLLLSPIANDPIDDSVWNTITSSPTPRPELLEALESVKGSAVQIALIPPPYTKRVLEESGFDMLPPPLNKTPMSVVTNGVRWTVLAADLDKPQLRWVIRSEHEQAARDLRKLFEQAVDLALANIDSIHERILMEKMKAGGVEPETFLKSFLPVPKENRLELTVNEAFIEERTKIVANLPETMLDALASSARAQQCQNHLKQIVLAFHNHHDTFGKFPPLHTVDKDGKPLHSWRVAILPYLEQNELYKKIRLDEPWDSEYNKQFHSQCPAFFQCPQMVAKNPAIKRDGLTTYSVIVGKNAYPEADKKYDLYMITDGTSNTLAVVERQVPVCWMDPTQEITQEEAMKGIGKSEKGIAAVHTSGSRMSTQTAFFDGSTRTIMEHVTLESLKALITRNGGESIGVEYDEGK